MIRKCLMCGKEFTTCKSWNNRYCSKKCSSLSLRKREIRKCKNCENTFEVIISSSKKYCSISCARQYHHKIVELNKEYIECPVCKISFKRRYSNQKFCSRKCSDKGLFRPAKHNIREETRTLNSLRFKSLWSDPEYRKKMCDRMKNNNPSFNPDSIEKAKQTKLKKGYIPSNNFRYGNGKISEYERKVFDRLIDYTFYYNHPINTRIARDAFPDRRYAHSYKPDFVNFKDKLCIEIDGYGHSTAKEKALDAKKEECLSFLGFTTIRFTHKEIDEGVFDTWLDSYQKNI